MSAVSARPLRAPWVEEKYSSTRQAFAEVGLDRRLDDLARGLGHQASHAGELADLLDAASGTRVGHQEDRVEVDLAARGRRCGAAPSSPW